MSPQLRQALTWAALFVVAALFVMVRAAIEGATGSKLRKMAEQRGGGWARRLLQTINHPDRFVISMHIATLAVAAAFSPGAISALAARLHAGPLGGRASIFPLAFAIIAAGYVVIFVVFVLLIPKKVAALRPYRVLRLLFYPAWVVSCILLPVSWLAEKLASGFILLFRIRPGTELEEVSEDEIRMMVDIGEVAGAIEAAEKEMIENVFEFNNMTAEDIMVHRTDMVVVWMEDTEDEILQVIRENGLSRFPVCGEDVDDVIGILNTRDYLMNFRTQQQKPLKELLRPAYFVPETVKTDALFREMQRQKTHMAIVVDEYGGTSGLLTMEDLIEQLVGDIYDEFDQEEELEIVSLGENLWRISGGAELETISEALGITLEAEDDEYDTLGGLIFSQLTVIPEDGSHIEVETHGLKIAVEHLADRRVEWARVSKILPDAFEPVPDQAQ